MRLAMTVRDWLVIDATMDNVRAVALQAGDRDEDAATALPIRQAGWDQVGTDRPENGGWPSYDAATEVELSTEQWRFVAQSLEYWATLQPPVDDDEAEADRPALAMSRKIRSFVAGGPD